jgi:hypothetical protein
MKIYFQIILVFITTCIYAQQSDIQYLSGKDAIDTVSWDFYCSDGRNSKNWTTIQVPSCWEQQGFGAYNYGHVPFKDRLKENGTYKRTFDVPNNWKDKQVKLVFEGVMTDAEVKINGELAGSKHQGAFYEFSYDISKLLKFGLENKIEVHVKKFSDNESINWAERKADFWIFGGIFRPVYLKVNPKENIQRVAVDAKENGSFKADVYISNPKKADKIEVSIQTLDGTPVQTLTTELNGEKNHITGSLSNPVTWNPEAPYLYKAVFRLKSKGKIIHEHIEKIGFRTVEVKERDGIYVNGARIKFKGVNRHTFHPDFGRTSSKKLSIEAVSLMKEMNMNAVRMSHYPPEKHFLEVCDSLGLFVLDELTGWQTPAYDETVGRKLVEEMIIRDVNHPSIVLWDNGNEGGWNDVYDNDFAKFDIQKRKLIHPWQAFRETNTLHYVDYNYLSLDGYSKRKIFFPTELLHGLYDGGHGAGLEDYWHRMWEHPLAAGAFLWVFADEGIARTDRNGELDMDGNHAPDGILGPYMEKEASFYSIKKIWSPIYFEKRYITSQFDGVFGVENRYHYTNLDNCVFLVEWSAIDLLGNKTINFSEEIKTNLEPGQKGKLKINLPNNWQKSHILSIKAKESNGSIISTWTYPVQGALDVAEQFIPVTSDTEILVLEENANYNIEVGVMTYSFNKKSGLLASVKKGDELIPLNNGPLFVSREKEVEHVNMVKNDDGSIALHVIYSKEKDSVNWIVQKNGLLRLKVAYEPALWAPYAGISFDFPKDNVAGMKWMGDGPYRVWKNRAQGTDFGLWEKEYNETITGHSGFDYPEFKGYHSDVYWAEVKTKKSPGFKVFIKSDDVFLRMLTPDQTEDGRTTLVDFPIGNISFLHGINAIGTKFKDKSRLGPQSSEYYFSPRKIDGRKLRMELVFDFGSGN